MNMYKWSNTSLEYDFNTHSGPTMAILSKCTDSSNFWPLRHVLNGQCFVISFYCWIISYVMMNNYQVWSMYYWWLRRIIFGVSVINWLCDLFDITTWPQNRKYMRYMWVFLFKNKHIFKINIKINIIARWSSLCTCFLISLVQMKRIFKDTKQ